MATVVLAGVPPAAGASRRGRVRGTVVDAGTYSDGAAIDDIGAREAAGGADLLIIDDSGRNRMAGRGSLAGLLPYGDATAIVVGMAAEVLPVVHDTPVLAGVRGADPFRLMVPSSTGSPRWASPACRTSRRSACTTAGSARIWRRPAWASAWRST